MYVRSQRRLGQYDSAYQGYTNLDTSITQPDSGSGFWSWLFPSESSSLAEGTAQIQSVPANAAAANAAAVAAGIPAPYNVAAIQAAADQQSGAFAQENAQLWAANTGWPWYYWAALAAGGVWLFTR
jgi:hypothetical protein